MFNDFLKPATSVVKKLDKTSEVLKSLGTLLQTKVLVGIPQENSSRRGETPTNAELAFIHTHGSPVKGIPPRPFLEPAIEANKVQIAKLQGEMLKSTLQGKQSAANAGMQKLGIFAQSAVKGWFKDPRNGWAPNTPQTIARKKSSSPLIDTGQLLNSITYVIRQK